VPGRQLQHRQTPKQDRPPHQKAAPRPRRFSRGMTTADQPSAEAVPSSSPPKNVSAYYPETRSRPKSKGLMDMERLTQPYSTDKRHLTQKGCLFPLQKACGF